MSRRLERREQVGRPGSSRDEEAGSKVRSDAPGERLQRTLGNRALQALLAGTEGSGPVLHAPDGALEQEAHRVAAEVTGGRSRDAGLRVERAAQGLMRAPSEAGPGDMSGGLRLGAAWGERLAGRRGAGRAIEPEVRADLEGRLGVGIAAVRVHSDGAAAALCRDLRAEAFTHGSDIYFGEGRYAPRSGQGAALLAHEVTHTIQQRGLERRGAGMQVRGGGEASAAIQGLVSRADFVALAGGESNWGALKGSTYHDLLAAIDAYHAATEAEGRAAAIDEVIRLVTRWKDRHTGGLAMRAGDSRREYYIDGLLAEAKAEKEGRVMGPRDFSPTRIADERRAEGDAVVQDARAAAQVVGRKYKFMVRAHIEHALYGKFARRRAGMVAGNKFKVGKYKKDSQEIKRLAARETVLEAHPDWADDAHARELRDAAESVARAGVGHTWVVFQQTDDQDRELDRKSFGLYPAVGLTVLPTMEAQPGSIHHPDHHDEGGGNIRERAWEIGFDTYKRGLATVGGMMRSPPDYMLAGYNCTYFAKMVGEAVGLDVPDGYFTLPNLTRAWNPNSLYDLL